MTAIADAGAGPLAGAGKAEITLPPGLFPVDGFNTCRDPLYARVVVLDDGRSRTVLASFELPSLRDYEMVRLRPLLADAVGAPAVCVWVGVSHALGAPHVRSRRALADSDVAARNDVFCGQLEAAAANAAQRAVAALAPCRIGTAQASSNLNVSRDQPAGDGWTHAENPAGYSDPTLTVVRIDGPAEQPIAVLYSLDLRPSVTEQAARAMGCASTDCVGAASRLIETERGGVALFVAGAMADQMPRLRGTVAADSADVLSDADAFRVADAFGALLARETLALAGEVALRPPGSVTVRRARAIVPLLSDTAAAAVSYPLDIDLLEFGDVSIIAVRPELTSALGTRIRRLSTRTQVLVWTMVDRGDSHPAGAKYLVDDEDLARQTLTAQSSSFAAGAGDALVAAARTLLAPVGEGRP